MHNIKFISIFAGFGFFISFICGLFSKSKFLIVLLRAFIFAIIFGLLAFLISFLYNKFLNDDSAEDISDGSVGADGTNSSGASSGSRGNLVDFVVQDAELERSDSDNHFVVNDSHQMLNATDVVSNGDSFKNKVEPENNFVPLKNKETVDNFSSKEAVSSSEVVNAPMESVKESIPEISRKSGDDIDTLPDMNSLGFENLAKDNSDSGDENLGGDTGETFVSSVSKSSSSFGSADTAEVKDASLMAKAISSILSDEN